MKLKLMLLVPLAFSLFELFNLLSRSLQESNMDGAWQLVEADYGNGMGRPQVVQLKVFHGGYFEAYILTPERSAKTMNGKFEVKNDSVYTETLINALNKPMIGKTYSIKYKRDGNTIITRGSFDVNDNNGIPAKGHFVETWRRVDYPLAE